MTYDVSALQAVVHLVFYECMPFDNGDGDYLEVPDPQIYSYPARVIELSPHKAVVETCGDEPTRYTFHIYKYPNGKKRWEVDPECLTYADNIQLFLYSSQKPHV